MAVSPNATAAGFAFGIAHVQCLERGGLLRHRDWRHVVGAIVFYIGVVAMNMNIVWFMVHVPVAFIFGTMIVLNMLQRSLFGGMTQLLKGVLNVVAVPVIGTLLFGIYRALSPAVTGVAQSWSAGL